MRIGGLILILLLFVSSPLYAEEELSLEDRACIYAYTLAMESITGTEDEAYDICVEAAEAGARGAQNLIAEGYLGAGDKEKALYWFKKSAEQGHEGAWLRVRELNRHYKM